MAYTYQLFDSIEDVDLEHWQRVRSRSGASIFTDPRLIAASETTMTATCKFWHVIVYDECGEPVACASLTGMTIDLLNHADKGLAAIIRRVPRILSRFQHLKTLVCGLPLSIGQKNLEFATPCGSEAVLSLLDGVISDLAADMKMDVIVYKEFGDSDLPWMSALLSRGYRRIPTLPMHFFRPDFEDFQHYCASLKAHYRYLIRRSIRKLRDRGGAVSVLHDTKDILATYTPDVHQLYLQVLARTEFKLENLPAEYFCELTIRLPGQIEFVTIHKAGRIMAFSWCLRADSYYLLYGGIDYELNDEYDLYFNLMYASLDCALRKRAPKIVVGQTADAFKARLGCYSEPLYAFVKGVGPLMSLFIRLGAGFLIAQKRVERSRSVFKCDPGENPKASRH